MQLFVVFFSSLTLGWRDNEPIDWQSTRPKIMLFGAQRFPCFPLVSNQQKFELDEGADSFRMVEKFLQVCVVMNDYHMSFKGFE